MTKPILTLVLALSAGYGLAHAQPAALHLSGSCPASVLAGQGFSIPLVGSGGNGVYSFSLIAGPSWVSLSPSSGTAVNGTFSLTLSGTPPSTGSFPLEVAIFDTAEDSPGSFNCTLTVTAPLRLTGACPSAPLAVGAPFSLALTASGGNGNYSFSIAGPSWLSVSSTGVVSGTPPSGTSGAIPFTVTLTDTASDPAATFNCTITVSAPLRLTGACPSNPLAVGAPFSLALTASGGNGSYSFSIAGPSWLSVSSTGVVSGTPPSGTAGATPFTVTLTDTAGDPAATFSCTITVSAPLRLTGSCPSAALAVGASFSLALTASGGTGNYSFSIAGPAWLSVSSTGVVSGTPPSGTAGAIPFTVTLTDTASDPAATFSCTITVTAPLRLTGACPSAPLAVGAPFSLALTASGGNGNYSFSIAGPSWLSVSSTGVVSGTPPSATAGAIPFTVTLTDAAGDPAATFSCSFSIGTLRLTISGCPASSVVQGTGYGQSLSASGGDGNFLWSIASGNLPRGLTLTGNLISGTALPPPGTSSFTIQVSSAGATDQLACSIDVAPTPPAITSTCPGNGVQGVLYSPYTVTATGGLGLSSYAFSVVNGSLPAGLILANGIIGGTPAGPPGTSVFTIQANSGQQTATLGPCSLTIAAAPAKVLQLTGTCPAGVTVGVPFSIPLSASGGTPPYAYAVSSGLPGLNVMANGTAATVTGTAPSAAPFPFTITLTDAANTAPATFSCTLIAGNAVKIQASCPAPIEQNTTLTLPLAASGGTPPYRWILTGPAWLTLTSNVGDSTSLSGAPPDQGTFPFTVTLTDSSGMSDTFSCTVTVTAPAKPPLAITPSAPCPASPVNFGSPFSLTFGASGGTEPYSWSFTGPPWLSLQSKTGPNTSISGTASVEGAAAFTLFLDDSVGSATVKFSCSLVVNLAPIPAFSLGLSQRPATIFDPITVVATLSGAPPVALEGDLLLTFTSAAFGAADNPQVQILDPNAKNNGRLLHFLIQPGAVPVIPLATVQQGTVAGVIRIELISLVDGTRDVLPTPHSFLEVTVPKLAPVMTSMTLVNPTASGFDILISGYSTPRDVSTAEVTFTPAAGASIQGTATFSVSTANLFANFYSSSKSQQGGSMFDGLRIPVSITGDKTAIGSVSVKLTNSVGASDVITKSP